MVVKKKIRRKAKRKLAKARKPVSHAARNKKLARTRNSKKWITAVRAGKLAARRRPSALRKQRLKLDLSQEAVAKKAGLAGSTYASVEVGKRRALLPRAMKVSMALRQPLRKLFVPAKGPYGGYLARAAR